MADNAPKLPRWLFFNVYGLESGGLARRRLVMLVNVGNVETTSFCFFVLNCHVERGTLSSTMFHWSHFGFWLWGKAKRCNVEMLQDVLILFAEHTYFLCACLTKFISLLFWMCLCRLLLFIWKPLTWALFCRCLFVVIPRTDSNNWWTVSAASAIREPASCLAVPKSSREVNTVAESLLFWILYLTILYDFRLRLLRVFFICALPSVSSTVM